MFAGDILSGVCFVGVLDETGSLLVFVPLALYMSVGFVFLLLGLISLVRIRSVMKRDGTKTDKLEKLIGKIGKDESKLPTTVHCSKNKNFQLFTVT